VCVCVCVYVCLDVCVYVCVYVLVCVCVCVFLFLFRSILPTNGLNQLVFLMEKNREVQEAELLLMHSWWKCPFEIQQR